MEALKRLIRDVPDFPKPGIVFKDITPLLADPDGLRATVGAMCLRVRELNVEHIVGIESRGFIFGVPLALELGVGFTPVRKPGKLPWRTQSQSYDLEYGQDTLEIHEDGVQPGQRVLVVDDLLATGGTLSATVGLVEALGGRAVACAVVIELAFLGGRQRLPDRRVEALFSYS
ncbi:MAG: adenine phosphoribosyltransferase [Pseudomonadota bacterium]